MKKLQSFIILSLCFLHINAQVWQEVGKVQNPDLEDDNKLGRSFAISDNYAIVGDPSDKDGLIPGNDLIRAGSAYILEKNAVGNWKIAQKIVASDRNAKDEFGNSVAISENYAFVGALDELDTINSNIWAGGAVYVFERGPNGNWKEIQKLQASDNKSNLHFGWSSVAVSGDYAVFGAYADYDSEVNRAGSAYIFEKDSNGTWEEVEKLVPSDRATLDRLGISVAIDGNNVVVGAYTKTVYNAAGDTIPGAGTAYFYTRDQSGNWNNSQKVFPDDLGKDAQFGSAVSINGNYAIVGAPNFDRDLGGGNFLSGTGATYIYEMDQNGTWNQVQKIETADIQLNAFFGFSVSIYGNQAIIGAFGADAPSTAFLFNGAGAAYIFERNSAGNWLEVDKIKPLNTLESKQFGYTVAIRENYTFVGAPISLHQDASGSSEFRYNGLVYILRSNTSEIKENELNFTAYPNPTQGQLNIDFERLYHKITVNVYNPLGQLISSKNTWDTDQIQTHIEGLSGLYLVQILANDGEPKTIKVIKE